MAESTTIARPYAEALFRLADGSGRLREWAAMLDQLAGVAGNGDVREAIGNPKLTGSQLADLFLSLCKGIDAEGENLVRLLVENRRLSVLPEVRGLFDELKNQREGVLDAQIYSAFPLDAAQQGKLVADLEARFRQRIAAELSVDPELIGGVKVVIGDQVIDASVRGKLAAMAVALKS